MIGFGSGLLAPNMAFLKQLLCDHQIGNPMHYIRPLVFYVNDSRGAIYDEKYEQRSWLASVGLHIFI